MLTLQTIRHSVSSVMKADAYIDANNGNCSGHGGAGSDSLAAAIEFRAVGDNAWYPGAPSICEDRDMQHIGEIAYRAQQALLNMSAGSGNYAFIEHYQTMVTDGDLDFVRFIDITSSVSGIDAYMERRIIPQSCGHDFKRPPLRIM